jgi:hypothetical protein
VSIVAAPGVHAGITAPPAVNVPGGFPSLPNVRYLPYDLPTLLQWVEGRKN